MKGESTHACLFSCLDSNLRALGDLTLKCVICRSVKAVVGVAHHVGMIQPYGLLDLPIVYITRFLTEFHWIDAIQEYLDYCGINYYGQVRGFVAPSLSPLFGKMVPVCM